ncbi:phytase [Gemmatimonas sp.]|uniref:phytase n=1 Tax=Gemmatimonas sp. TaxID=1962908 RepID=UPI0031F30EF8
MPTAAPRSTSVQSSSLTACAVLSLLLSACRSGDAPRATPSTTSVAATTDTLRPVVVTSAVLNDSDDPAIWIDTLNPSRSLIVGTDKGDSTGGLYVFTLDGRIDSTRTRRPLKRPNNVDIITGVSLGGKRIDVAVTAERGTMSLRMFRLPDMTPIDGGGIKVFDGDATRAPMGIAMYRRPGDGAVFAIVGGKSGPSEGYLWQYRLADAGNGTLTATRVRTFGAYSGKKEIEAIAVDQHLGFVYYSDETVGIRKYYADPDRADAAKELALFGTTGFVSDHEGIAVYPTSDSTGYLVVSDQQGHRLQLFAREGSTGAPHTHVVLATIPVAAQETDGLDVTAHALSPAFPEGLLVMMSTDKTFHLYDWRDVRKRLPLNR